MEHLPRHKLTERIDPAGTFRRNVAGYVINVHYFPLQCCPSFPFSLYALPSVLSTQHFHLIPQILRQPFFNFLNRDTFAPCQILNLIPADLPQ